MSSYRRRFVHDLRTYDYAIVRVVPRVERGEFVNAGIILSCDIERVLQASIELDEAALLALDAGADLELVRSTLATIPAICAGGAAPRARPQPPPHHSRDLRGRGGRRGHRQAVCARAVSLAGLSQKHHRADIAGT